MKHLRGGVFRKGTEPWKHRYVKPGSPCQPSRVPSGRKVKGPPRDPAGCEVRWRYHRGSGSVDVCGCAAGASGPLLAQARRRRRAKASRKPHATKRAVIGTASPRLNRSADNASDTADNASNTAAATATLKARFIPGSSKRSQGVERLQRGRFGRSQSPQLTTPHSIPTGPPLGAQKIGARA
jgi:hypothetical protein